MKNEPRPFLDANSIGKEYKAKDGKEGRIVGVDKDGCFIFRWRNVCWLVYANGRNITGVDCMTVLPPESERRTEWLCVYDGCCSVYPSKSMADQVALLSERQGDAVPVNLERQPDGNWKVVAEKTKKELAADAMYDGLRNAQNYLANLEGPRVNDLRRIVSNAIAKAEGRE